MNCGSERSGPGLGWRGPCRLPAIRNRPSMHARLPRRDDTRPLTPTTTTTTTPTTTADARPTMSVEFFPLEEAQAGAGAIREIRRALVDAAALVTSPEYSQAVVEVREEQPRRFWI